MHKGKSRIRCVRGPIIANYIAEGWYDAYSSTYDSRILAFPRALIDSPRAVIRSRCHNSRYNDDNAKVQRTG